MFVSVKIRVKDEIVHSYINPKNFLYAEEYKGKEIGYSPCLLLYSNHKGVPPMRLNMTLEELGDREDFVLVNVRDKDGSHPIVISEYAIRTIRKWKDKANPNLFVIYMTGADDSLLTHYTMDDIISMLS